jgi:hypothetical protein
VQALVDVNHKAELDITLLHALHRLIHIIDVNHLHRIGQGTGWDPAHSRTQNAGEPPTADVGELCSLQNHLQLVKVLVHVTY